MRTETRNWWTQALADLEAAKAILLIGLYYEELQAALRRLNPAYTNARYPDAVNGVPAEAFDQEMAQDHIAYSERVVEWARSDLHSKRCGKRGH